MTFVAAAIGGLGGGLAAEAGLLGATSALGGTLGGAAIGAMAGGSYNQAQAAKEAAQTQYAGTQYAADIQKQMFDIGAEPVGNTQAQMAKQIADETVKFTGLAKAAKLSIE